LEKLLLSKSNSHWGNLRFGSISSVANHFKFFIHRFIILRNSKRFFYALTGNHKSVRKMRSMFGHGFIKKGTNKTKFTSIIRGLYVNPRTLFVVGLPKTKGGHISGSLALIATPILKLITVRGVCNSVKDKL
jgi:hypothetical protein